MKQCTKCKEWKDKSCFYKHKECKDGLDPRCKTCISIREKQRRQKPEVRQQRILSDRKYRKTKNGKYKLKNANLKYHYGITLEEYDQMFEQQNGVCAICSKPETAKNKYGLRRLSVDHDHKTGEVRGLLCTGCNLILGHMRDNKERVLKAAIYLEQHNDN